MTTTTPGPPPAPAAAEPAPAAAPRDAPAGGTHRPSPWRRRALWTVVVLLVGVVTWLVTAEEATNGQALDPHNPGPRGAQAVAEVLREHGVEVTVVRSQRELLDQRVGPGTSVVVTRTEELSGATARTALRHARRADRVVLAQPEATVVSALDLPVDAKRSTAYREMTAHCSGPAPAGAPTPARTGERLSRGEVLYTPRAGAGAHVCFPPDASFAAGGDRGGYLVSVPAHGDRRAPVVLHGSTEALQNGTITEADNAAVTLRALGASPHLIWYVADFTDVAAADQSAPVPLFPAWFAPALTLVATAVAAMMVWRGRRLGRLVTEPLPVVVRAVETTESRGRLYRRSRDRGRAAAVLRADTRQQLTAYLGLPSTTPAPEVAAAAAAVSGRPEAEVARLLCGPAPQTDEDLVQTAQGLASLEEEVRR